MKIKVGFVCVHNSCRSQMAEAVAKINYSDFFEAYSAGTELVDNINQDAVKTIKNKFNVDMNKTQKSKLVSDLPELDVLVTMGCNVECPYLPNKHREDWGLDDPSHQPQSAFDYTLAMIEEKMEDLKVRIENGTIKI